MKIGLIDVDSHNFPNFALMRISAFHKEKGDSVEWATQFEHYDRIYASKVFTFSKDINRLEYRCDEFELGGTGYDITKRLEDEIEESTLMDYSIYPDCNYSVQFFSRGCIRHCPFCLVHDKEGGIHPVKPVELNPRGEWIEILDNNFFANPEWRSAAEYIVSKGQKVKLHGVDIRIMDEEQAYWLNRMKHKQNIHIAWGLPKVDLTERLREMVRYVKPWKITCYILVGFNSTPEQDLHRIEVLKSFGIVPFVQPYRDYGNKRVPTQYEKDLARWANNKFLYKSCSFEDFSPRKGFKCSQHFK